MSDSLNLDSDNVLAASGAKTPSLFDRLLKRYSNFAMSFEAIFPDGTRRRIGQGPPDFQVTLKNERALRAAMSLDEGKVADSYLAGDFEIEGDMLKPFEIQASMKDTHPLLQAWRHLQPLLFGQVYTNKQAIHSHYDIDPGFFLSFLDPKTPCYTQGVYADDDETLDVATLRKFDYAFRGLNLKPGDHILEIGPGWGAWFEYASARGVKCTGISISRESIDYLTGRARTLGHDWELVFSDLLEYRTDTRYDAIVIMGVIEHLPDYQRVLEKFAGLIKPGGRIFLDGSAWNKKFELSSFMVKHIYGGNHSFLVLPDLLDKLAKTQMQAIEIFNDSKSYMLTLIQWAKNLDTNREAVVHRFGDYNFRRFRLYLWGAAAAFARREMLCYRMIIQAPKGQDVPDATC
ncbi:MAG TPA: class I SAM-dependent methyltransferase [Rhizomicrobium sp.]